MISHNATPSRKPRVLIATARKWLSGARLSLALRDLGCEVTLLSPADHPARLTGAVSQWIRFQQLRPFRSFERALDAAKPDSLILADEVVQHYALLLSGKKNHYGYDLRDLIKTTTAGGTALRLARKRFGLLHHAHALGVAVPATEPVPRLAELPLAAERIHFPMVLKSDGSAGGQGVRVVGSLKEAETAWSRLHSVPSLPRVLKRGMIDGEWMHLRRWMRRLTSNVSAQQWISGPEMTSMAVAHAGKMLASVAFEVVQTTESRGPSSVLRVVENPHIQETMSCLIADLGISGFCGFDFITSPAIDAPLLLEMNTRPTQISHLSLGKDRDLVAAYVREVLGLRDTQDRPAATQNDLIALFPQELHRDANSPWIKEAWMDVPWDSRPLIQYGLQAGTQKLSEDVLPQSDIPLDRGRS